LQVDYIIVGQGIGGTLLAHFLKEENQKVLVYEPGYERAASEVAAGIINPITGRRYVKSWKVDELIPFARQTYQQLERSLDVSIYHPHRIIRTLFNQGEENDWLSRTGEPAYEAYMLESADLGAYASNTEPAFRYGEVRQAAQVDIGELARAYRLKLEREESLKSEVFEYDKLEVNPQQVSYKGITARGVVFCEGAKAIHNPFFNYLPFGGAKGEVLLVRIPGAGFEKIFKHRIFIVPLKSELYWIGATYEWKFDNDRPTRQGRGFLEERLRDVLTCPFEVVSHRAAIRPTVKDRRPFLGSHPDFARIHIFNGLGTKGASLGPYWAAHMAEFLLKKRKLDKAVDIKRF
jgi:glycine/D-amino acid oxidase-like deaminating enzyme